MSRYNQALTMEGITVQTLTKEGNINKIREIVAKCAMLKKANEECAIIVETKNTSAPDQEPNAPPLRSQIHKCTNL